MKSNYENLGKSVGRLVAEKQAAYGDSFGKSHKILKVLYPDGIKPEQYMDVLTICRVVDKLFRLATDPTYGDESPWRDICGYSLLSMGKDSRENDGDPPQERIDEVTRKLSDDEFWAQAKLNNSSEITDSKL